MSAPVKGRCVHDREHATSRSPFVFIGVLVATLLGCDQLPKTAAQAPPGEYEAPGDDVERHPTEIVASRELGTLKVRAQGDEYAGVRCGVCHVQPDAGPTARRPEQLEQFHTGMEFEHGEQTCNSCHHPDDRDLLRLADGTAITFEETMRLCTQCHGPQTRDYRMGSHGGMTGYWDTTRGPRTRNHCVNCHDPHVPVFPKMRPWAPPTDTASPPEAHD